MLDNLYRRIYLSTNYCLPRLISGHLAPYCRPTWITRRYGVSSADLLVIQLGALIPEKGCEDLLLAAAQIYKNDVRVSFQLAGDRPAHSHFEGLAAQLGIADRVTFAGLVADPLGAVCTLPRISSAIRRVGIKRSG
jgi:glycosyltransferase involved in cell wall biosynthesis